MTLENAPASGAPEGIQPLHPFSIPEGINYSQTVGVKISHDYLRASRVIAKFVGVFVPKTSQEEEQLRLASVSMGGFDDGLDECSVAERATARDVCNQLAAALPAPESMPAHQPGWPSSLKPELPDIMTLWANALKPKSREKVRDIALRIGEISVEKANTDDIKKYVEILIEEGKLVSDWMTRSLSPDLWETPGFKRLEKWGGVAGIAGVLIMEAISLPKHKDRELTEVPSTPGNRMYLVWRSLPYLARMVPGLAGGLLRAAVGQKHNKTREAQ